MEHNQWAAAPSGKAQRAGFVQVGRRNAGNRTGIVMGGKRQAAASPPPPSPSSSSSSSQPSQKQQTVTTPTQGPQALPRKPLPVPSARKALPQGPKALPQGPKALPQGPKVLPQQSRPKGNNSPQQGPKALPQQPHPRGINSPQQGPQSPTQIHSTPPQMHSTPPQTFHTPPQTFHLPTQCPQPFTFQAPPSPTGPQALSFKPAPGFNNSQAPQFHPVSLQPPIATGSSGCGESEKKPVLEANFFVPSSNVPVNFSTAGTLSQNPQVPQCNVTFLMPSQEPAPAQTTMGADPKMNVNVFNKTNTNRKVKPNVTTKTAIDNTTKMKLPPPPPPSSSTSTSTPSGVVTPPSSPSSLSPSSSSTGGAATPPKVMTNIITAVSSVPTDQPPAPPSDAQGPDSEKKDGEGDKRKSIVSKSIEWYRVTVSILQTRGVLCKSPFVVGKVDDIVGYKTRPLKSVAGDPRWDNEAFVVGCYRSCEYNGNAITLEVFENDKQGGPRLLGACKVPVTRKTDVRQIGVPEWLPLHLCGEGTPPCGEICVKVMASPAPRVVFESPLLKKQNLLKFRPVHAVLFEPALLAIYESSAYTNELERINIGSVGSAELVYSERRMILKLSAGASAGNADMDGENGGGGGSGGGASFSTDALDFIGLRSKSVDYTFSGGKPFIRNWVNILRKFCFRTTEEKTMFPGRIGAGSGAPGGSSGPAGGGGSGGNNGLTVGGEASQYFGVPLRKLAERGLCTPNGVPKFVQTLIDTIARRGLMAEGIFRVNGTIAEVKAARARLEEGAEFLLPDESVHVVSGLLKLFLRELPEPIFTFELYQRFINSVLIADFEESKKEMKSVMMEIPRENVGFLRELVGLLCKICENSAINKMNSSNLSIVFAPTLIWSDTISTVQSLSDLKATHAIIELIIENATYFFPSVKLKVLKAVSTRRIVLFSKRNEAQNLSRRFMLGLGAEGGGMDDPAVIEQESTKLFRAYDADGNGSLDVDEFNLFFIDLIKVANLQYLSREDITVLMEKVSEGDMAITLEQFLRWWTDFYKTIGK